MFSSTFYIVPVSYTFLILFILVLSFILERFWNDKWSLRVQHYKLTRNLSMDGLHRSVNLPNYFNGDLTPEYL